MELNVSSKWANSSLEIVKKCANRFTRYKIYIIQETVSESNAGYMPVKSRLIQTGIIIPS